MNFIKDIYKFIKYLSFVDVIFFMAIIMLLILLVVLVYFIKINKEEVIDSNDNNGNNSNGNKDDKINVNNTNNDLKKDLKDIVDNIEITPKIIDDDEEEGELIDLKTLTKRLEEEKEKEDSCIGFTDYEKDQEEKAIISYEELLKKKNQYQINYEKEIHDDDLVIKKVDLSNLVNKNEINEDREMKEVRVISYEKEEAFLSALKELNRLLN